MEKVLLNGSWSAMQLPKVRLWEEDTNREGQHKKINEKAVILSDETELTLSNPPLFWWF
jgi:hypothetical protein